MGVSIYFKFYRDGSEENVSTERVVSLFTPYIKGQDDFGFRIKYTENSLSTLYIDRDEKLISNFSIDRPSIEDSLLEIIFEIDQIGFIASMISGYEKLFIFKPETINHLEKNLLDLNIVLVKKLEDIFGD